MFMRALNNILRLVFLLPLLLHLSACGSDLSGLDGSDPGTTVDDGDPPVTDEVTDDDDGPLPTEGPTGVECPPELVEQADLQPTTEGATIVPRFETAGDDFYRMPWPSDYRRHPDGRVDLGDFPNGSQPIVRLFVETIEEFVTGYSAMPVIYVALDGAPEVLSLPAPQQTIAPDSPVQLIDLSAEHCGDRTPIVLEYNYAGDRYRGDQVLSATPVVGFPLAPERSYALIVTVNLGHEDGFCSEPAQELAELLAGNHANGALVSSFAPLAPCLSEMGMGLDQIAGATVFTTQDAVGETRTLVDAVHGDDSIDAPTLRDWRLVEEDEDRDYVSYRAEYDTPIFQTGVSPYNNSGEGVFEFDGNGAPIVQRWEEVPLVISWPDGVTGPVPVMIWVDGTGARLLPHRNQRVARAAFEAGFAVASFSPQFHGDRAVAGSDEVNHSFNYANPASGRTVFRQQVADTSYYIRVLREALPDVIGDLPELDTDTLVYGGQSQGGLVGAMLAGVEGEIDAYFLNGTGSYITETVLERKDPFDIAAMLEDFVQVDGGLDEFHPVIALVQLGADPVDPYNYARYWSGWEEHPSGSHMFLANGMLDHTTPQRLVEHITIVGDLAPIAPAGWDVDPYGLWDRAPEVLPISGNRTALDGSPLTLVTYLDEEQGHYTVFRVPEVRELMVSFWETALNGTPVVER